MMITTQIMRRGGLAVLSLLLLTNAQAAERGAEIYRKLCAECHGDKGQGVEGHYDDPLYGNRSLISLAQRIEKTMPEDNVGACTGEDAKAVAKYIFDAFYSPAARARTAPAKIDLARLTESQYRTSVADVVGAFRGESAWFPQGQQGLKGRYFGKHEFRGDKERKGEDNFERFDTVVKFDFKTGTPDDAKMKPEEFSIRWNGLVAIEETGEYEFIVRTQNGARLWVNNWPRDNNHLIDAWVSSGDMVREETAKIHLLGGRSYPIQLDYFKYKEKTASIELLWKPPHGVRESIPAHQLSPNGSAEVLVLTTPFPADDRSVGYERGTSVSKEWYQASMQGALETANWVIARLNEMAKTKDDAPDRREKVKEFCAKFAEVAFRRPLSDEQRRQAVDVQFEGTDNIEKAVKRSILFTLSSPRFLYPGLTVKKPDDYTAASHLALALWDSVPDKNLLEAARKGELRTREQLQQQAWRMVGNTRARAKLRGFFHHWLELDRAQDISKDEKAFPDFDEAVMADLRTSLNLFLENVVWSEKSDYRELLTADYLYVNSRLAKTYGLPDPGPGFQRVAQDPNRRSGVVTHPFLLSSFAYHNNSSPIHRGVFLTRNIVGLTLKPPPEAVKFEDSRFDPKLTMREKVTEVTRSKACMGCHSTINPLGFSLENYDAIGRWRTQEKNKPIDAAGEFHNDEGTLVKLKGARDVAQYAAGSHSAQRAFVAQLFHHGVKQSADAYGVDTLDDLRDQFAGSNFNVRQLLVNIAVTAALESEKSQKLTSNTTR